MIGGSVSNRRALRWAAALSACVLTAAALFATAPAAAAAIQQRIASRMASAVRMQHRFAEWSLRANGIRWRSNGQCSDRHRIECTSLEGIRWGSLDGLVAFKERSGCPLMVSGGTETGHAKGRFSHWNGYKIDVMPSRCVDQYILRHYRYTRTRGGDEAELYQARSGAVFAQEAGHWDILFG